jgi:hypothetical protein
MSAQFLKKTKSQFRDKVRARERWIYRMATISRLLKTIGIFCRISSLLQGSFAKETYHFKEPTNRRHPIGHSGKVRPRTRSAAVRHHQQPVWALRKLTRAHINEIFPVANENVWFRTWLIRPNSSLRDSFSSPTQAAPWNRAVYTGNMCRRHIYLCLIAFTLIFMDMK